MKYLTQEEKDHLLKELCARLPYEVKCEVIKWLIDGEMAFIRNGSGALELTVDNIKALVTNDMYEIKPYLFPLSSMTEEQKNDCPINETNLNIIKSNIGYGIIEMPWRLSFLFVDWCNKNHFDYRGLIPMGLAIDATGLNIY